MFCAALSPEKEENGLPIYGNHLKDRFKTYKVPKSG
jgi:hypothetical protein